jgi:hypothetical protein
VIESDQGLAQEQRRIKAMTIDEAREHGEKAGRAINERDQARYNFESRWFREAISYLPNKAELRAAWDAGYKDVRESDIRFRNLSARW